MWAPARLVHVVFKLHHGRGAACCIPEINVLAGGAAGSQREEGESHFLAGT